MPELTFFKVSEISVVFGEYPKVKMVCTCRLGKSPKTTLTATFRRVGKAFKECEPHPRGSHDMAVQFNKACRNHLRGLTKAEWSELVEKAEIEFKEFCESRLKLADETYDKRIMDASNGKIAARDAFKNSMRMADECVACLGDLTR